MKALIFALSLGVIAPAMGRGIDDPNDVGAPSVRYLSWCTRAGQVMEEGPQGQARLKFDCAALGQACVQQERIIGGGRVAYAFCQAKR